MTEAKALAVVFIAVGILGAICGLLEVFFPGAAVRLQVRSTSKARGTNRAVGEWLQRQYKMDLTTNPFRDSAVLRRVRWTGLVIFALGVSWALLGLNLWS
jgi:hypothetical protein